MLKTPSETRQGQMGPVEEEAIFYPAEKLAIATGLWINGNVYGRFEARETLLYGEKLTLKVTEENPHSKISFLNYFICNHAKEEKRLKLLAMHLPKAFSMDHFSFVSPADQTIFHLTGDNMFLVGGENREDGKWEATVIPSWHISSESIWGDIGKGALKYSPLAKGNPASILSTEIVVPPGKTARLGTWIISGESKNELVSLKNVLLKNRLAFPNEK
ncbi:hypothetical protein DRW41_18150 [Neobacillus piezotolerans]|uniref:Uncharacterized protein n=1 Tax=Neobacillus piezotolerans TaxID=2259171 RepID=A0A3D8GMD2_9BACI|nr:hypothetical protein [Neobacillus piezotolerans]RDU35379.1 hypothetical protein DRW41_18150 [Neobacillus piezotolerans]